MPLRFNIAVQHAIRKIQVNQNGLKLNADDFNTMGGSIHTIKKNTDALVVASK